MQLAPSKNPEKESKTFSLLGLGLGLASLVLWFLGIAGLAFSVRGVILSLRTGNKKLLAMACSGTVVSLGVLVLHFA